MAEPKNDPDELCSVHKISNHLGNSRLEESLNDFLELHSEELRLELHRAEPPPRPGKGRNTGGQGKPDKYGQGVNVTTDGGGQGQREFSHRVHSIYQDFLAFVQGNLEEFLEAEGLTEGQLRDACEREMQAKDPGGLTFMHTLISSWEFSSEAGVAVFAEDSFAAEGGRKGVPLFAATTRCGLDCAGQGGGGVDADVDVAGKKELLDNRHAATACCGGPVGDGGDPPGTETFLSEARVVTALGSIMRGRRRSEPGLPTRAEGKS
eukprot:g6559.t1